MPVEVLLPVDVNDGRFRYAGGVKAGRWLFATGHMATDFKGGIAADVLRVETPHYGPSRHEREAEFIFRRLNETLDAGGLTFKEVVRVDQYYSSWKAVNPYQRARLRAFEGNVSPSTSILQNGFTLPDAGMNIQLIALAEGSGEDRRSITPAGLEAPSFSGYSALRAAGGYIFVAGQMARGDGVEGGDIAPDAMMPRNHYWSGIRIIRETEYLIEHRLEAALKAGGSSLANIVKAQVYLADIEDTADFFQAWAGNIGDHPMAVTVVPTANPGFGLKDARMEINLIALPDEGPLEKHVIDTGGFTPFPTQAEAIRAGDLLLLSGLMAVDERGLVPAARIDPRQPYFGSSIEAQMAAILDHARRICEAAGSSLENVVRIQQFHTDIAEFYPANQVWRNYLPDCYLPISAVEVGGPLPVPGASVLLDLWVHAP